MSSSWTITDPASPLDLEPDAPRRPPHPGEILRLELMEPLELTLEAIARAIEWPELELAQFLDGDRPVTPDLAIRLGYAFSTTAEFWMNLQTHHDLEVVRRFGAPDVERLPVLHAAE